MFKEQKMYVELVDPLLEGDYPERGLNQAVAVAAMCLQEEASVRPLMNDVVAALSFLMASSVDHNGTSILQSQFQTLEVSNQSDDSKREEESAIERERAVAQAIEWGSNSRRNKRSQNESSLL